MIANSITGRNGSIGPVVSTPSSDARWPSWNTNVITPRAAPMLSRFSSAAFSGTSTERNTTISSSSDSPMTTPMNTGSLEAMTSPKSTVVAVAPPMLTARSVPRVAGATTSSRRRASRSLVAAACGLLVGVTVSVAVSPASL
jgi:hypothetical protein